MKQAQTRRPLVLATVMVAMFITAVEATIVATAMPSIVSELGGFESFSWVFSVFLLMQSVTIPIYGKLADLFGRKPIFATGMIIFLIGSLLCGIASSMTELIIYRMIQGLGAGAVMPITMTIIGDIYSVEERGKVQGYTSSVWAFASIIGPALGGIFVEYISWVWVFWINIPLGILTLVGLHLFLHEDVEKKKHTIDYWGSFLLLISITSLMFLFVGSGTLWSWMSVYPVLLAVGFIVFLLAFVFQENRATEPMMSMTLWRNKAIVISNLACLVSAFVMIGVSTFLPTYVQGVMGKSASIAGFTLATMSIGWPLASTIGGRYMMRIGLRRTSVIGGFALIIGAVFFVLLRPEYGPVFAAIGSFFVGVGLGLITTACLLIVQASVDWKQRGSATALNMFMRTAGSTIGASFLAGILNLRLKSYLDEYSTAATGPVDIEAANDLLDPAKHSTMSGDLITLLQNGLTFGLHTVYWALGIIAVATLLLIFVLPKPQPRPHNEKAA